MANRYWVTGSTNNWSDTSNWSTTSGGTGGASVPGAADNAIFDTNSASHNCTLDQNVNVNSWYYLTSGYGGTIDCVTFDVTTAGNLWGRGGATLYMGSGTFNVGGAFSGRDGNLYGQTATLRFTTLNGSLALSNTQQDNGPNLVVASGAKCNYLFTGRRDVRSFDCYGEFYFGGQGGLEVFGDITIRSTGSLTNTSGGRYIRCQTTANPTITLESGASCGDVAFTTYRAGPSSTSSLTFAGAGWATATGVTLELNYLTTVTGRWTYVFPSSMNIRQVQLFPRYSSSKTTLDFSTNSTQLIVQEGFRDISSYGADTYNINVGASTLTFALAANSTFSPRGNVFPPIIVGDNAVGTLTLDSNVTTPYVHDCANQIDENGYTVTTTGTDPSPCSTGARYWVGLVDTDYENTGNWSTSSGGLGNASVPVASNDVVFDSGSSANCTMTNNRSMNSLNFASYAGTFAAGANSVFVTGDIDASGSTAIIDLGSSNWTVGGDYDLRFISASSSEGTSTLRMTSTTLVGWKWKPSGGFFYSITLAPNASVAQGRNLSLTGSFTLESGSTWAAGVYTPVIRANASLTLGPNSSITTTSGHLELYPDGTGTRTGDATASVGSFRTWSGAGQPHTPITIPIATYTGDFVFRHNDSTQNGTWRFEGDSVIEGDVSTVMGKATSWTIDTATNNVNLTLKGDVDITPSQGSITWSRGDGTIIFDNIVSQSINFNGQTVEGIHVTDASTGSIVLANSFSTAWLRDCNSLIDLNGYTITNADTEDRCAYPYDPPTTIALDSTKAITTGLQGWWPLVEGTGTTLTDISATGDDASEVTNVQWSIGVLGNVFDGTGSSEAKTTSFPVTNVSAFSVSYWIYWDAGASSSGGFLGAWASEGGKSLMFRSHNSNTFVRNAANSAEDQITLTSTLQTGSWVHVVLVVDNGNAKLYRDGSLDVEDAAFMSGPYIPVSAPEFYFGHADNSYLPEGCAIQNVKVWNIALTSQQASTLYSDPWIGSDYTAVVPLTNRYFAPAAFRRLG